MDNTAPDDLLTLSQRLLDAIDERDWETYCRLCDENLTAFEPETSGHLVEGLPFHKFYFDRPAARQMKQSTISNPRVQFLDGVTALVTYIRLVQKTDRDGVVAESAWSETRIWTRSGSGWKHIHFHRSEA